MTQVQAATTLHSVRTRLSIYLANETKDRSYVPFHKEKKKEEGPTAVVNRNGKNMAPFVVGGCETYICKSHVIIHIYIRTTNIKHTYLILLLPERNVRVDPGGDAAHGVQARLDLGVHRALHRRVLQDSLQQQPVPRYALHAHRAEAATTPKAKAGKKSEVCM